MWNRIKNFYKKYREQGWLIPIVFIMGIVPLVVKQKDYMTNLQNFSWYPSIQYEIDVFNYYKKNILITVAVLMALLLLVDLLDGSIRLKKASRIILAALAVYEALAALSCWFSDYRWFSIHGTLGHFETVYVLLAYGLLLLYTYYNVKKENDLRAVLFMWGILLLPMVLLGFSQAAGHDFYQTGLGSRLILTKAASEAGSMVKGEFGKGRVYLSLYNPNYVGSFGAMTIPVMVTLCLYAKSWKGRLLYGILSGGLLVCLMGALAKTGLAALAASLVCLVLFFRKQIICRKQIFLLAAAVGGLICLCFVVTSGNKLVSNIRSAIKMLGRDTTVYNLESIETGVDGVKVSYKGNELNIRYEVDSFGTMAFAFRDGQGQPVKMEVDEANAAYKAADKRFEGITITPAVLENRAAFGLNIDGKLRYFSNDTPYEGYYYYGPSGKFTRIRTAPHWGFEGYEKLATYRGYTWSRTIPMLKDNILLGSGPDTFLMEFPQDDYVAKARYGFEDMLLSKPHNMFLQIGTQTGVLSLAAYLTLYGAYALWSLKLYWKNSMEAWLPAVGASVFTGITAYMIAGLTTDSTINVAPVFWCLLGLGMAANQIMEDQQGKGLRVKSKKRV